MRTTPTSLVVLLLLAVLAPAGRGQQVLTAAGLQSDDRFGWATALSGDVLVSGAYERDVGPGSDQGAAVVFRRTAGAWSREAELSDPSGSANDWFGRAVAVDGDVVAVGAPRRGPLAEGAVLVFRWDGSSWVQEAELFAETPAASDQFGSSVHLAGDVLAVGAPNYNSGVAPGSVTVFRWDGAAWVLEQTLVSSDGQAGDALGAAVAVGLDLITATAPGDDVAGASIEGSVREFVWNGGSWVEGQTLVVPTGGDTSGSIGNALDLSDDTLVVGQLNDHLPGEFHRGAAHVFRHDGSTWSWIQKLTSCHSTAEEDFGTSVAVDGDRLLVGEPYDTSVGVTWDGTATLFTRSGPTWVQGEVLCPDDPASENFGRSIALDGDTVAVGAPWWSPTGVVWVADLSTRGTWEDLGGGTVGALGPPRVCGCGSLEPGASTTVLVGNVEGGLPLPLAWVSLAPTPFAAIGGTVHAWPFTTQLTIFPDASDTATLGTTWPAGIPSGTEAWIQTIQADATVIHGLTLSNGTKLTTP